MPLPPVHRRSEIAFLQTELDNAKVFLRTARALGMAHPDAIIQRERARAAYDVVSRALPGLELNPAEKREFDRRLAAIKRALIGFGEVLSSSAAAG